MKKNIKMALEICAEAIGFVVLIAAFWFMLTVVAHW